MRRLFKSLLTTLTICLVAIPSFAETQEEEERVLEMAIETLKASAVENPAATPHYAGSLVSSLVSVAALVAGVLTTSPVDSVGYLTVSTNSLKPFSTAC